jgi:hypothetical protein
MSTVGTQLGQIALMQQAILQQEAGNTAAAQQIMATATATNSVTSGLTGVAKYNDTLSKTYAQLPENERAFAEWYAIWLFSNDANRVVAEKNIFQGVTLNPAHRIMLPAASWEIQIGSADSKAKRQMFEAEKAKANSGNVPNITGKPIVDAPAPADVMRTVEAQNKFLGINTPTAYYVYGGIAIVLIILIILMIS